MTNKQTISTENLQYLEHICNDDFYKNDREFIEIIKKLTLQSANMSNKALSLVNLLDEAERVKFEMVEKELKLSLNEENKPYGFRDIRLISNKVLVLKVWDKGLTLIGAKLCKLCNYPQITKFTTLSHVPISEKQILKAIKYLKD